MKGGKAIHEKWLKESKKMKAVALFRSDHELTDIPRCAKDIMSGLGLSKSKGKKKEFPVWIQEFEVKNKYYYMIFIALGHEKLYEYNDEYIKSQEKYINKTVDLIKERREKGVKLDFTKFYRKQVKNIVQWCNDNYVQINYKSYYYNHYYGKYK